VFVDNTAALTLPIAVSDFRRRLALLRSPPRGAAAQEQGSTGRELSTPPFVRVTSASTFGVVMHVSDATLPAACDPAAYSYFLTSLTVPLSSSDAAAAALGPALLTLTLWRGNGSAPSSRLAVMTRSVALATSPQFIVVDLSAPGFALNSSADSSPSYVLEVAAGGPLAINWHSVVDSDPASPPRGVLGSASAMIASTDGGSSWLSSSAAAPVTLGYFPGMLLLARRAGECVLIASRSPSPQPRYVRVWVPRVVVLCAKLCYTVSCEPALKHLPPPPPPHSPARRPHRISPAAQPLLLRPRRHPRQNRLLPA
jgi:hypothetical protein